MHKVVCMLYHDVDGAPPKGKKRASSPLEKVTRTAPSFDGGQGSGVNSFMCVKGRHRQPCQCKLNSQSIKAGVIQCDVSEAGMHFVVMLYRTFHEESTISMLSTGGLSATITSQSLVVSILPMHVSEAPNFGWDPSQRSKDHYVLPRKSHSSLADLVNSSEGIYCNTAR